MRFQYSIRTAMLMVMILCALVVLGLNAYRKHAIIFHYEQHAQYMTHVGPEDGTLSLGDIAQYFGNHSGDVVHLGKYLKHEDQWRRWTAARTMGEFGDIECLPLLRHQLEVEEMDHVKIFILEAISSIKERCED